MTKAIKYLILHCTATRQEQPVTSDDIRRWHTSPPPVGRGWKQVGYTDMIHLDGRIERLVKNNEDALVDPWEITNGAVGENSISRSIVYVGGLSKDGKTPLDTRTTKQLDSMTEYILNFVSRFPDIKVAGHNQFANKACPSFDVPAWLKSIGIDEYNIYQK